jgi:hypothetical protein
MRRSLLALSLACALTACSGGGGSAGDDADASGPPPETTGASGTGTEAAPANAATATACTDTGRALTPLTSALAGGDLEGALLLAQVPAWEPSGISPTVELALARMELELSFAKQAAELGVLGAESRSDLQRAYDSLADACEGIGSRF